MSNAAKQQVGQKTSLLSMLFVLFLALKLTHLIAWSWWWVCAPLWIPWAIIFVFMLLVAVLQVATKK